MRNKKEIEKFLEENEDKVQQVINKHLSIEEGNVYYGLKQEDGELILDISHDLSDDYIIQNTDSEMFDREVEEYIEKLRKDHEGNL